MNIFQNPAKVAPKKDEQIVRVDFEQSEIAGRKDHMPNNRKNDMVISHVPNQG